MILDLHDIISTADKSMEVSVLPEKEFFVSAAGSFPISSKKPFLLRLFNDDNKRLRITGSTEVELTIPCDRCLEEVKVPVAIHIEREAELSDGVLVPDPDEETDTFLQGEQLDVDRLIDDEILVNWPTKVLCREDCKGICPKCGQNLNQRDCGCDRQVLDPRMAKFQDVFKEYKEVTRCQFVQRTNLQKEEEIKEERTGRCLLLLW